tara:strand:+ start:766 stop:987 length:222 start_codon:yes stop_codon:yes gene_type:complete
MRYHIKEYLKNRGFNLSALAKSMDMSFQKFDHHIKPKQDLSYNFVCQLSGLLNIDVNEFIKEIKINNADRIQN